MSVDYIDRMAPSPLEEHGEISVAAVLAFLRRQGRFIGTVALVCAVGTLAYLLIAPREYTANAAFTPQASNTQSALVGLASQFVSTSQGPTRANHRRFTQTSSSRGKSSDAPLTRLM